MMKRKLLSLLLAGCLCLSLAACGGNDTAPSAPADSTSESGTPKAGGSINVGLNTAPVSENIWYQNDLNSSIIMNLVCPNMVAMDESGTKYNYLTESAVPNDDCTQWTVTLKEGLCWNDGTPVTADDLLFTGKYGVEHHIGFFDSYYGLVDYEKSHTDGDRTVVFELTSGNVNFWNGAGFWIPIMRQSEWESVEDPSTYDYSGAGYGPYYIKEWVDGEYVVLERNPNFTLANDGQGAYLDEVVFRIYTDENAMVLALQNGEIDVCADFLSASSVSQLQSNPVYQLSSVGSLGYALLTMSQTNPLLTDKTIRQAIAMCCDRDALVNVAFAGAATPMYTPISPVYGDFVASNIQQPAFDTAAAADLLEQAGYKDANGDGIRESADGTPLRFTLTYKSTLSNVDGVMTILKTNMAEAGIEIVLQPVDAATFSANVTQGHTYDISYSSWGTIDDVDTTLLTCFGIGQTLNFMEFNDQTQEDLLQAMQGEVDYEKRIDLLNQWQTWFVDNLPCIHLLVPNNTYAASTEKYEGWSLVPGNQAFMACAQFCEVYAK
jgi:peptide/nickel transport system substrate-binding protein